MRARAASTVALVLLLAVPAAASALADEAKGYAEYRRGDVLVVEGQLVRATAATRFEGDGVVGIDSIPLGWEVEVEGERDADGVIVAREIEAKPNGPAMFEADVLEATDEIEAIWLREGRVFEPGESGATTTIGRIVEEGPRADRVRAIMRRLAPPYIDPDRDLRVHVVDTREWNAAAMGNGAIWVYTGLIDSMSDDELAVVLGHELAHYTHEHSRRQAKSNFWRGLVGLGAALALEAIDNEAARAAATVAAGLGLTVWASGYSRDHEDQADRVGLRYAHEAGYDVGAGTALWAKFRERYGEPDEITNFFFGSHSRPSDRIRNVRAELGANYPSATAWSLADAPPPAAPSSVSRTEGPVREERPPRELDSGASDWRAQVEAQLARARHELAPSFERVHEPWIGELGPKGTVRQKLWVRRGREYVVVGFCDLDCADFDLAAYDARGRRTAIDFEPDDYPVLQFTAEADGAWAIEAGMPGCDAATCVFGVQVYER